VLTNILRSKRNKVPGDLRRLHNEQLYEMCYSPNNAQLIKSRMRWETHLAHMEEGRDAYRDLVGKPKGKRSLARSRHRWNAITTI
jgi:hypothetical protein